VAGLPNQLVVNVRLSWSSAHPGAALPGTSGLCPRRLTGVERRLLDLRLDNPLKCTFRPELASLVLQLTNSNPTSDQLAGHPTCSQTRGREGFRVTQYQRCYCQRWTVGTGNELTDSRSTPPVYIGDPLGTFESIAPAASAQNTLSEFRFDTSRSWNPNYSTLLSFHQLKEGVILFSCKDGRSSRVDDDIVMSMAGKC